MTANNVPIRDLALIGDRRTTALLDCAGNVIWYCPGRFDRPSLLASLLDADGGRWEIDAGECRPLRRAYIGASGVLQTVLSVDDAQWIVTDFMPIGQTARSGLCRLFSVAPADARIVLIPKPDYRRMPPRLEHHRSGVRIAGDIYLYASHPLHIDDEAVSFKLPRGESGWAVLADSELLSVTAADLESSLSITLDYWRELSARDGYSGPYERELTASLRALRLLSHEATGGLIASATTSLPEVPGGAANWDYRYVWLRDAGMIVSALVRLGGGLAEGERYLDFICSSRGSSPEYPVSVFTTLDHARAPEEQHIDFCGYLRSRPVRVGNGARDQMQLDAFANVLLAAKLIYQRTDRRPHWQTVTAIADYLAAHWREPDHGIWEEPIRRQYTASKAIVACGLDSIAEFSTDEAQTARWRSEVRGIREFVSTECLTSAGAYAVFAGSEDVDVSAALFPIWAYTEADSPEMRATISALEQDYSWKGLLFWRHLECSDSRKEGAFLAATFWMAQYWVMRADLKRAGAILDAGLDYANDLGLFAEEGDPRTGLMAGNFPQAFVHAAFIGAVIDLRTAIGRILTHSSGRPEPVRANRIDSALW